MRASVTEETVLPFPPDEAWKLVSEPEHLAGWLGAEVELDLREGGAIRVAAPDGRERVGVVDEVCDGERLRFRWRAVDVPARDYRGLETTVEIAVEPTPDGSRVRVTESGLMPIEAAAPGATAVARWAWSSRLAVLRRGAAIAAPCCG